MSSIDAATESMIKNLADKTGKSLEEWITIARKSKMENSSWRTICMADWKFFAASMRWYRTSGSFSPVS